MNTRLQVEHPVTELVTGIDLVEWQIRIARGERLTIDPARAQSPAGHAIECRIYAEDPDAGFMPAPGRIADVRSPSGPGIRDDSGVAAGFDVPVFYDSMISKLAAWGETRQQAIARMRRALSEYEIRGITTTIPFFQWLLQTEAFAAADFDTTSLDAELARREGRPFLEAAPAAETEAMLAAAIDAFAHAGRAVGTRGHSSGGPGHWARAARREALR
jgi:acetyl-CoA carboxylase biotin carboxylase subunit